MDNSKRWRLIETNLATIRKHANRIARNRSNVDDLTSELSLLVFDSLDRWDETRLSFDSWVGVVAGRRLPRLSFRQHGPTRVENEPGTHRYELRDECDPDVACDDDDESKALHEAIELLPVLERKAILLRFGNHNLAERAKFMELSTRRVKKIEKSAIAKLRNIMGETDDAN